MKKINLNQLLSFHLGILYSKFRMVIAFATQLNSMVKNKICASLGFYAKNRFTYRKVFALLFVLCIANTSFTVSAQNRNYTVTTCAEYTVIDVLSDAGITCIDAIQASNISAVSQNGATVSFNSDKELVYSYVSTGKDIVSITVNNCGGTTVTFDVDVDVIAGNCPDNISPEPCFVDPPSTDWSIIEVTTSFFAGQPIHNDFPLLVGDLDGDGENEIIAAFTTNTNLYGGIFYPSRSIYILKYNKSTASVNNVKTLNFFEGTSVKFQDGTPISGYMFSATSSAAIARYNDKGYIVVAISDVTGGVATNDVYLCAVDPATGTIHWKSTEPVVLAGHGKVAYVNIADFNADGIPEVYSGNKIFSLATGELLCSGTGNSGLFDNDYSISIKYIAGAFPAVADMDGDGKLELIAGNQIYSVDIPPGTTFSAGATMTVTHTLPSMYVPSGAPTDGITQVIDIDNDGELEVLVVNADVATYANQAEAYLYIWKPSTDEILGSYHVENIIIEDEDEEGEGEDEIKYSDAVSYPMIGDIDNDGYNEIVFVTRNTQMYALDYVHTNAVGSRLVEKWRLSHTDYTSGATGMTLFDFNQDGQAEIVYRDENDLRIIDGSGDTAVVKSTFNLVTSNTIREFPVIADVDGDGQAEIVVAGGIETTGVRTAGRVRIFKSGGSPWAPARKVWNQYCYNALNVNEDLTIPQILFNAATVFPGKDGVLGTDDDLRPYNNIMQQQTILNRHGYPLWLAPDAQIIDKPVVDSYTYDGSTGTLEISNIKVTNGGSMKLNSPLYISVYKMRVASLTNYLGTAIINEEFAVGETKIFSITLTGITESVLATGDLLVRVNDNNNTFFHVECDYTNNAAVTSKNFWKGTTDTDWGKPENWTENKVPYPGEDVEFATESNNPTHSDDPTSGPAINDLVLDQDRNIGNLINESDKSTIIPPSLSLVVEGKVTGSETASDVDKIQIQADADNPNGSLILSCANQNTDVYASVQMYARGSKGTTAFWTDNITGSPTSGTVYESSYSWQYFGVPVEEVKASPTFNDAFVKVYNESQNAANSFYGKWTSLANNVMMNAFKGYEITQDEPTVYTIKGKLVFCDQDVTLTRMAPAVDGAYGTNERYGLGQNIIGNSFTAAIPVDKIDFAPDVEETVYLYNTGRFSDWGDETGNQPDGTINVNATTAGNYRAIPKHTASAHPYRNIPSMQGFLLWYKGADDSSVTQTLPYADLTGNDKPQTAPQASLSYLEVTLNSESTVDKLWLFSQAGTGAGFDNGWDGRKFFGTPTAFIFAPTPDGHMQVSTSENIVGSYISFVGNTEKNYTLSLRKSNLDNKYPTLYLVDLKTKEVVLLKDEVTYYSFTADNVGTAENRFRIKNTTDIGGGDLQQLYALLVDNKIQLTNNSNTAAVFSLYDTMGHLVEYRSVEGMSVDMFSKSLVPGVYIVKMTAGGADVNKKIVVSTN